MELAKLITKKYSENLQKNIVVNPNSFTSAIFKMVSESVRNIVVSENVVSCEG